MTIRSTHYRQSFLLSPHFAIVHSGMKLEQIFSGRVIDIPAICSHFQVQPLDAAGVLVCHQVYQRWMKTDPGVDFTTSLDSSQKLGANLSPGPSNPPNSPHGSHHSHNTRGSGHSHAASAPPGFSTQPSMDALNENGGLIGFPPKPTSDYDVSPSDSISCADVATESVSDNETYTDDWERGCEEDDYGHGGPCELDAIVRAWTEAVWAETTGSASDIAADDKTLVNPLDPKNHATLDKRTSAGYFWDVRAGCPGKSGDLPEAITERGILPDSSLML
ncbi:hypothetical protein HGRIS_011982 [Hohenbuehelia grisea]|uniref:Uncharacterized protein n=1 Tax=Hohenbuehelia grisea TaxID=104357 RepID=A0ABR3JYY6_9AGAR